MATKSYVSTEEVQVVMTATQQDGMPQLRGDLKGEFPKLTDAEYDAGAVSRRASSILPLKLSAISAPTTPLRRPRHCMRPPLAARQFSLG
ncbi:hypothetical protein PG997_009139 [Apiospora hydei]|uniref:Uncharacterized protein n=1 Tax=Apiospora hydei TaxID=1337664 RepID=A0ABR1VT81_9PEZI